MAVMHPVDIENYDYTPTEKDLYYALKEQLPDKYQVFYGSMQNVVGCPNVVNS